MNIWTQTLRNVLASALLLATLAGCSAESAGPEISAAEANRRVEAGELTLVDIRRPEEWRETGVAKGAARIDMRQPDFTEALLKQVNGNPNAPVAIICRTGNRTTQMQRALTEAGFTQIYNVREGMAGSAAGQGWIKQGLPVTPCTRC